MRVALLIALFAGPASADTAKMNVGPMPAAAVGTAKEVRLGLQYFTMDPGDRVDVAVEPRVNGRRHKLAVELWSGTIPIGSDYWWKDSEKLLWDSEEPGTYAPALKIVSPSRQDVTLALAHWPEQCGCRMKTIRVKVTAKVTLAPKP